MSGLKERLVAHYGTGSVLSALQACVQKVGKSTDALSADELARADQFHPACREATSEALAKLDLAETEILLDVGCGIGGFARSAASGSRCQVKGIDLTPEYVEAANAINGWMKLSDKVVCEVCDATCMASVEDAGMDKACMLFVCMNIPNKAAVAKEVFRALKPGGKFISCDLMAGSAGNLTFPSMFGQSDDDVFLCSQSEFKATLDQAGFQLIEEEDQTKRCISKLAANIAEPSESNLDLSAVCGPSFAEKMNSLHHDLNSGRVQVFQHLWRKPEVAEPDSKRRKVGDADSAGQANNPPVDELSAAQIINMASEMLAEVQGPAQSNASGMLRMCFADAIAVAALDASSTLVSGRDRLISALVNARSAPDASSVAEPTVRVVWDTADAAAPSFALDLYGARPSPMACLKGGASAVLSRARKCQLDQIWVGEIRAVSKAELLASAGWQQAVAAVQASVTSQTAYTVTYNNYAETEDKSGLGLGSVSVSESWAMTVGEAPIKDEEIAKALEAFNKVTKLLGNDGKFAKAAKVLQQMLSSHLLPQTCPAALAAIKAALGSGERATAEATREVVAAIVEVAWDKRDALCGEGSVDRGLLTCWHTHCTLPRRLHTDDSFAFAKAAKDVQVELEQWKGGGVEGVEGDAEVQRCKGGALFACLQQLVRMYQFQWARTPVDMCFKVLVDPKKRALFGVKQSAVEDLINILQRKKKGNEKHDSQGHYQASGFQHGKMGW